MREKSRGSAALHLPFSLGEKEIGRWRERGREFASG